MNTSGILQKVLSVSLNRYYLDLPGSTFSTDVEEIEGKEEMSELYCYTVRFTSDAGDIQPQQMLRKKVWLNMQASSDELKSVFPEKIVKVIHGVITHFRRLQGSRDQVSYEIIIEPFVSLLGKQFHSHRFFVNKSVPEVVTKILTEHGWKPGNTNLA